MIPPRATVVARAIGAATLLLVLAGCGDSDGAETVDTDAPDVGVCRVLSPEQVAQPSDDSDPVECSQAHTAETIDVGDLPGRFDDSEADDPALAAWVFSTCSSAFMSHLKADESVAMRTILSWAWFRPTDPAWDAGARWYRCDLIGGGEQLATYVDLPETTKGLLQGMPADEWMVCGQGESLSGSTKLPCSEQHTWRAVTTIKVGEPGEKYPGDRIVEVTTRDYCSDSVGAWLGYPDSYDYAYTWFHQAEWDAGNRRSVCWARTAT